MSSSTQHTCYQMTLCMREHPQWIIQVARPHRLYHSTWKARTMRHKPTTPSITSTREHLELFPTYRELKCPQPQIPQTSLPIGYILMHFGSRLTLGGRIR